MSNRADREERPGRLLQAFDWNEARHVAEPIGGNIFPSEIAITPGALAAADAEIALIRACAR